MHTTRRLTIITIRSHLRLYCVNNQLLGTKYDTSCETQLCKWAFFASLENSLACELITCNNSGFQVTQVQIHACNETNAIQIQPWTRSQFRNRSDSISHQFPVSLEQKRLNVIREQQTSQTSVWYNSKRKRLRGRRQPSKFRAFTPNT